MYAAEHAVGAFMIRLFLTTVFDVDPHEDPWNEG